MHEKDISVAVLGDTERLARAHRNNPNRNNPIRNNPTRNNPFRNTRAGRFLCALHTASIRLLAGALGYWA